VSIDSNRSLCLRPRADASEHDFILSARIQPMTTGMWHIKRVEKVVQTIKVWPFHERGELANSLNRAMVTRRLNEVSEKRDGRVALLGPRLPSGGYPHTLTANVCGWSREVKTRVRLMSLQIHLRIVSKGSSSRRQHDPDSCTTDPSHDSCTMGAQTSPVRSSFRLALAWPSSRIELPTTGRRRTYQWRE
jgi:hypothetical protein